MQEGQCLENPDVEFHLQIDHHFLAPKGILPPGLMDGLDGRVSELGFDLHKYRTL